MPAYDVTVAVNYSQVVRVVTDDVCQIEGLACSQVTAPEWANVRATQIDFAKLQLVPSAQAEEAA